MAPTVPDSPVRPGRPRQLLTLALLLAMGVAALEGTVVTTALPTVVGELHGLALYPWVFSVYLLTSTTTVPVYGKLADLYGRKPVFLLGLALFLLGTFLSGASGSMLQLVVFRAIQGLGAGAVLPLTLTVLADIYTLHERAHVQSLTASVWGVLSLAGPTAGAVVTQAFSWRWVFWANVPVCLVAVVLLWRFLEERVVRREAAVDYAGAITLTLGLVTLLVAALEGGHAFAWRSWQLLALALLAALFFAAFALAERRAADPVLPFAAFRVPEVAVSNACNVLFGVVMFGLTSYVPLFAQGVLGESATGASAVLTPMQVAWSAVALLSGRLYVAAGFRRAALLGTTLILLGTAPLLLVQPGTPLVVASIAMAICGLGMGISATAFLLAPQSAVPWQMRGAVTSSTQFSRTIGGSVGVALLGAVLNARLTVAAAAAATTPDPREVDRLSSAILNAADRAALPPETLRVLSQAMAGGLHLIYVALFVVAAAAFLQTALFARTTTPQDAHPHRAQPADLSPTLAGDTVVS